MRRSAVSLPLVACAALLVCVLAPALASASSAASAASASASAPQPSEVVVLTDENFDELTSAGSWLLEFYGQRRWREERNSNVGSKQQQGSAVQSDAVSRSQ